MTWKDLIHLNRLNIKCLTFEQASIFDRGPLFLYAVIEFGQTMFNGHEAK